MIHNSSIVSFNPKLKAKREKYFVIALLVLLSCSVSAGLYELKNLSTGYSVRQFLPESDPLLVKERKVKKTFALEEAPAFLVSIQLSSREKGTWLESPRIKKMKQALSELASIRGVKNLQSIANARGAGEINKTLTIGSLFDITPVKKRYNLLNDSLLAPSVISRNGRTVLFIANMDFLDVNQMKQIEVQLRSGFHRIFPNSKVEIGGVPAIQTDVGDLLLKDLKKFVILAFLVSVIVLSLIFSNLSGILITLLAMAFANTVSLGSLAFLNIPFTVLSTTIPILVSIAVLAITTHTLLRIDEERLKAINTETRFSLAFRVLKKLFIPNLLSSFTTCVGFLTLLTERVPVIHQYGVSTAASVMVAWLITQVTLLALIPLFPTAHARPWTHHGARWSLYIFKYRKTFALSILFVALGLGFEGRQMNWSPKLFDDLPNDHRTRIATENIDRNLGGILPLEVTIEGKKTDLWNEPRELVKLSKLVEKLRMVKNVGSAISLPDFLSEAHLDFVKAKNAKSVAETYFLYSLDQSNPLRHFLTSNGKTARISLRLFAVNADATARTIEQVTSLAKEIFSKKENRGDWNGHECAGLK